MFKKRREQREAEAAQRAYEEARARWDLERQTAEMCLNIARTEKGSTAAEAGVSLMLKKGEAVIAKVEPTALVEPRRLPGRWEGGSHGVSLRIARGVYYRVGATRGTFQQGAEAPAVIDSSGTTVFTNQRAVFVGMKQSREWAFVKMLGIQHDEDTTYINVSNRQRVSGFRYPLAYAQVTRFCLDLALAHHQGTVEALISEWEGYLGELRRSEPQAALPPPPSGY